MAATNLDMANVLFFDQEQPKRVYKRSKRSAEELKAAMRHLIISSRTSAIIQKLSKKKKHATISKPATHEDALHPKKRKLLDTPRKLSDETKSQLEEEDQNDQFEELKANAHNLLRDIEKMFYYCKVYRIPYPGGLENILNYNWADLTKGANYTNRNSNTCQAVIKPIKHSIRLSSLERASEGAPGVDKGTARKKLGSDQFTVDDNASPAKEKANRRKKSKKQPHAKQPTSSVKTVRRAVRMPGEVINFSMLCKDCREKGWMVKSLEISETKRDLKSTYLFILDKLRTTLLQIAEQNVRLKELGYDKPIIFQHYEDTKKDETGKFRKLIIKPPVPVLSEGLPRIPIIKTENLELKKLRCEVNDGCTTIYYPSGRIAICRSHSCFSCPGAYYTNVFSDTSEHVIVASFTPFGFGSVCFPNGYLMALYLDQEGGMAANEKETEVKVWKWPRIYKLFEPIRIRINEYITVRVSGQFSIWVIFRWYYEVIRFPVASLWDIIPPTRGEMGWIQTDTKFTSKTGKELLRIRAIRLKEKMMRMKWSKKKQGNHVQHSPKSSLESNIILFSTNFLAQDLWHLQLKIRQILADWLNYYRTEIGLNRLTPFKIPDSPVRPHRNLHSKLGIPHTTEEHPEKVGHTFTSDEISKAVKCLPRSPSFIKNYLTSSTKHDSQEEVKPIQHVPKFHRVVRLRVPEDDKPWLSSFNPCPVALRLEMMEEGVKRCKCNNHKVPLITDLEYDTFLNTQMPGMEQIIVICVVSSALDRDIINEKMLEQLYERKNRNRSMPCPQSQADSYRLIKYEINPAARQQGDQLPLLQQRHNINPGMFLMYIGGKLLFADYILNGYSTSSKDLLKQITQTRADYLMGHHLHCDFKFRPMSVIPRVTVVPNVEPEDGFWASYPEPFDRPLSKGAIKLDKCLQSYDRTIPVTRFIPLNLSQTSYLICEQKRKPNMAHIPTVSWMKSCCPFKPVDLLLGQKEQASVLEYNMHHA